MPTIQQYLNQNYTNKEIKELDLSGWNENEWKEKLDWEKLTGELDLSEFPNLEKLDCSFNKITSLNLSNCPKLTELKCWDNELTEIRLPKSQLKLKIFQAWNNYLTELNWGAFNPQILTYISISNNNFSKQNVSAFSEFINLEELYVGNDIEKRLENGLCNRFHGSLEPLKKLTKLKKIQIEGTKIKEDFEHLLNNLQIVGWSKQNSMISSIVPLERLYVIRGNVKQFINKWEAKKEKKYKYELLNKLLTKQEKEHLSELSKLQSPEEIDKSWWTRREVIYATQFLGRSLAATGIALSFQGYSNEGAGILGIYPFTELIVSNMEKTREDRKNKWKEFLADADIFLDNYHELLGIVSQFKTDKSKKGKVNEELKNLSDKIEEFLSVYDSDGNREVEIDELISKKNILFEDLSETLLDFNGEVLVDKNNQEKKEITLHKIVDSIKQLEEAIIEYRKFSYYEEMFWYESNRLEVNNKHQKYESQLTLTAVDLDDHFEEKEQLETKIEVNPNN